ncbi:MAG: polyprenyl synthetase family protein [Oscillospiraceae bacterium]|nr:polyprenyl synthetase family protein [Oscillospiraceae bacterium]
MSLTSRKKSFQEQWKTYREEIEEALDRALPKTSCRQEKVIEAMRYSLLGGGKRIRAILVLEFARLGGISMRQAMPVACALEMIHAYSLIHDDLPCMDDDALRRGKPSCHIQFGEATALLAGDGLLTCAFETAAQAADELPAANVLAVEKRLSACAGYLGMIGGQVIDLESEGQPIDLETLEQMYRLKTGALLEASCVSGCLLAGQEEKIATAENYARFLGLAFQIVDDILDVTGDPSLLGKPVGSDEANHKNTFVTLLGLEKAQEIAKSYTEKALRQLEMLGAAESFLTDLTDALLNRLQ